MSIPRILIIAGSDSGGGAGIQADIKTVTMLGGHAMTAITAITAQNTLGVTAVHRVPVDMVVAQIDAVVGDIGVDAVKIGMIGSAATAHAVADRLGALDAPIVFDPVMIATSGSVLADDATIAAFERLMRVAAITTPNVPELAALGGIEAIRAFGTSVLAKGGDAPGEVVVDRLVSPDGDVAEWTAPRIVTRHGHGTGCTLASAIAMRLAQGRSLIDAVADARLFVRVALHEAPGLGAGHGPLGHAAVRLDLAGERPTLNQITLPATDHAAAVAFYRQLGFLQIVDAAPRYARFENEGGVTLSIEAADAVAGAPLIFLESADLDGVVARLRATGHPIADPLEESWGWREARLHDPSGNALCLYQAGEYRRFPPWRVTDARPQI